MHVVSAQNVFSSCFLFYLQSSCVSFEENLYIQRHGVWIGSCLAPILGDLLLARYDQQVNEGLGDTYVLKVFLFVDDFLILFKCDVSGDFDPVNKSAEKFSTVLHPLQLTRELPCNGKISFLDTKITFEQKRVLAFSSPLSKGPAAFFIGTLKTTQEV